MKTLILFAMYGLEGPERRLSMDAEMEVFLPGLSHVAEAAAFTTDPITSQGDTPPISLPDLVRLCPDFVEYEEIREDTRPNCSNDVSKLRLQHVSVKEFFVTRNGAEYSPVAGHAFLARLCMQYWLKHSTWLYSFGNYSGANWGDHLLQVKSLAQGNLEAYLEEDHDLGRVVNAFLGGKKASEPFTTWSKWMEDREVTFIITRHATQSWTTKPPSTIFARIELELPIEELGDDTIRTKGKYALQFAQKVGNEKAIEYLKALDPRDSELET
jgi:hypothetical protein